MKIVLTLILATLMSGCLPDYKCDEPIYKVTTTNHGTIESCEIYESNQDYVIWDAKTGDKIVIKDYKNTPLFKIEKLQ